MSLRGFRTQQAQVALRRHGQGSAGQGLGFGETPQCSKALRERALSAWILAISFSARMSEEGELHAFCESHWAPRACSSRGLPMTSTISHPTHFDQAHKPHRHIITVIRHEEWPPLVEQMGEDGELHPADDLSFNEAGNVAGIVR